MQQPSVPVIRRIFRFKIALSGLTLFFYCCSPFIVMCRVEFNGLSAPRLQYCMAIFNISSQTSLSLRVQVIAAVGSRQQVAGQSRRKKTHGK